MAKAIELTSLTEFIVKNGPLVQVRAEALETNYKSGFPQDSAHPSLISLTTLWSKSVVYLGLLHSVSPACDTAQDILSTE